VQGSKLQGATVQGSTVQGSTVQGSRVQGSRVQGSMVQGSTVQVSRVQGSTVQTTARASLTQPLARAFPMLALLLAGYSAHAETPLAPETVLVAASGAPAPTQETFTIAASTDLTVTFTDLQTPAALSAASVAVTQGASLVSMTTLAAGATTATLSLPAAVGQYTLRVIATPNATATPAAGSFSVCVAPTATPKACIADASITGSAAAQSSAANPTLSTQSLTLDVVTAGSYTFTYADAQFPVALKVAPTLALFKGSTAIAVPVPASPAVITLAAGTYTLLAFAQADPVAQTGLYGIVVTGPALVAPLVNSIYPVGLFAPPSQVSNPSAQSVALTVTDFTFPTALAGARAVVTEGGTLLGSASAGAGASSFMAPAGVLQVWSVGTAGTGPGTYEVDLTANSVSLLQSAAAVNGGGALAYGFVTPKPLAAGSYQATANDFEFPSALSNLQFAVAQNGAVLKQQTGAGSLAFTAVEDRVVLLVAATPVTGGYGLVDVNIQTSGSSPQLEYDQIQPVGASLPFTPQPISIGTSNDYVVTLADLQFPAQFGTLALIGTSNGAVLGKVYAGGTFDLSATPGNYQFFIVAIPAAQQQYGLYALQVLEAPPTVTLSASPTSVVTGGSTTLSWTTTNSATCTGSGGTFTGNRATGSGSATVTVAATTTYTLSCTGPGGSAENSVTVTASTMTSGGGGGGGGGGIGVPMLGLLGLLVLGRLRPIMAPRRAFTH
jgi:hypothetical protein